MTSLTLVRQIAARPSIVFEALTTPEGIASWWGPDEGPVLVAESDPRVGGSYRVMFRMKDGSEHQASGEYLVVDAPTRLKMSFRWAGPKDDSGPSQIEILLKPVDGGTEVTFTQTKLRDEEVRTSHIKGWSASLDKLALHVEAEEREEKGDAAS